MVLLEQRLEVLVQPQLQHGVGHVADQRRPATTHDRSQQVTEGQSRVIEGTVVSKTGKRRVVV